MYLDDDAKLYLTWEATSNVPLDDATLVFEIDGAPHTMNWLDDESTQNNNGTWTRRAVSDERFIGSAHETTESGDFALGKGTHIVEPILTFADGQIVPARPFELSVA